MGHGTEDEADRALCRGSIYSAFAVGFGPPGEEARRRLGAEEGARNLERALSAMGLSTGFAPPEWAPGELRLRHDELFGHTTRGRVSAYETEYGGGGAPGGGGGADDVFSQTRELTDVGAFFAAFGLKLDPAARERSDHVRCECELMAFLACREALALDTGESATVAVTRDAQRAFLRDHLGRFAPTLGAQLGREDPGGFYGLLGVALRDFVLAECARFEVSPGRSDLGLRLPMLDDAPMGCGGCELAGPDCGDGPDAEEGM